MPLVLFGGRVAQDGRKLSYFVRLADVEAQAFPQPEMNSIVSKLPVAERINGLDPGRQRKVDPGGFPALVGGSKEIAFHGFLTYHGAAPGCEAL